MTTKRAYQTLGFGGDFLREGRECRPRQVQGRLDLIRAKTHLSKLLGHEMHHAIVSLQAHQVQRSCSPVPGDRDEPFEQRAADTEVLPVGFHRNGNFDRRRPTGKSALQFGYGPQFGIHERTANDAAMAQYLAGVGVDRLVAGCPSEPRPSGLGIKTQEMSADSLQIHSPEATNVQSPRVHALGNLREFAGLS